MPEDSSDCVMMAILLVSGGQGFWRGMASVQRLCEECEEWITFLYEKVDVMGGVSDVGNHERV
jgi:hypothetical protein